LPKLVTLYVTKFVNSLNYQKLATYAHQNWQLSENTEGCQNWQLSELPKTGKSHAHQNWQLSSSPKLATLRATKTGISSARNFCKPKVAILQ